MKHEYAEASPDADFLETRPPPLSHDSPMAELMAALGASNLRAVIFDLDTRLCHDSWQINEDGESNNEINDGGAVTQFVTAMATIAQLSQTSAAETLVRQLNPRRCAFAWRIDERRVAVAEVRYVLAQTGRRDQDAALLRERFIGHMLRRTPVETVAAAGSAFVLPKTALDQATAAGHGVYGEADPPSIPALSGTSLPEAAARLPLSGTGAALFAMILFCLLAATVFLVANNRMESVQREELRLRAQADATMSRQVADVLAQGDYGEVQAELDTFAELGYFQEAVVTNAQRRVVALVGTVQYARIGDIFPADASRTAKVVALQGRDQPGVGHLMTWGMPGSSAEPPSAQRTLLIASLPLGLAALVAAGWLLARSRRRGGLGPPTAIQQSDGPNQQRSSP